MKPKENKCKVKFQCNSYDCVYCVKDDSESHKCKYDLALCMSKVAQVNAMVVELKEMGVVVGEEEIDTLKKAMREIYEVWAGSEGIAETTASEAYQAHLIYEMRDIASKFLNGRSEE